MKNNNQATPKTNTLKTREYFKLTSPQENIFLTHRFYEDTSAKIEELSSLTATLQKGQAQTGLTFTKTQDEHGNDIASEVKTIVDAYKDLEGFD